MTALAVFRALWGFLRSPLGKVLAGALCLLAVLWLADARGYRRGVDTVDALWAKRLADSTAKARVIEDHNADVGKKVEARVEAVRTVIQWRTKTLIERIPADAVDPTRGDVPGWLVRLHDEAATGVSSASDPAGKPDGPAVAVGDARLAETVIGNYGACHDSAERLRAWQSWAIETGLVK